MEAQNLKPKIQNDGRGFTFIDILVGTSIVLVVFLGIFGAYQLGLKVVGQAKARITATALASQKIEMIKNLPYKEIGTTPHSLDEPAGEIPQTETIMRNNIDYNVETEIIYINDCFDGPQSSECPSAPLTDDCPRDYKRAKVQVSWSTPSQGELFLLTDIMPRNLNQEEEECTGQAAGVLSVSVFDALGQPVIVPLIELADPETGTFLTSSQPFSGKHDFVLAPGDYKITVSKVNYSSSQTYQAGDIYQGKIIAEPLKAHASVYEGRLTETGFSIDALGDMAVEVRGTKAQGYPPIHNATFKMEGVKTVGNDGTGKPIYKYSQNQTTNGAAQITVNNLEWDSYSFYVDSPDYHLIGIEFPVGTTTTQPVDLLPGESKEVRLILKAENTFLATVKDASTTEPVFGAGLRLFNFDLDYDEIQPTDREGKTLFIPLQEAAYSYEVQKEDYQTLFGEIWVSGDATITVELEQIE